MIKEKNFHVVFEGVSNQDSILEQVTHLLLDYLEILTWKRKKGLTLNLEQTQKDMNVTFAFHTLSAEI